jgi:type I restriction enzyme, S subunit
VLDQAEALRAKRRAALAQLDSLTQSLFLDLFGDPSTNPKGWPCKPVGELASKFSDGPFGSNLKSEHYTETGVRVVRLQNIGVGVLLDDDAAYISERHFGELRKHECLPGDVLIGTLGDPNLRACIQPAWLRVALNKADCVQLRPDERVANATYICALLNQPATERMAQDLMYGQTRVRISMGRLLGLEVPVPPSSCSTNSPAE